jgi:hypothetical protein
MADEPNTLAASEACAVCGKPLPRNAPGGLCPACLMGRGAEWVKRSSARAGGFVPPAADDLALLFPDFEIVRCLGQGGMGAVYQAVQRDLDRTVAIKILPPEIAADAEFSERFRREASALASLDHPNIVRLFDYGQREGLAYFVMEFVDGVDLSRRIASGPVTADEAFGIVSQLCDALHHSHGRGVVHRDIKPANLLITREGRVKVADFGLARLVNPGAGDPGLTRTNATLGTPRYMAPEQMAGASGSDHRVDIYAVGVVLYELLTGHMPVGHFDAPSEKIAALNPHIDEVVLRALSTEPERRFATAEDVKSSLREAIERPAPTRHERARRLALGALMASVAAAAIAGGAAWLWVTWRGETGDESEKALSSAVTPLADPSGRIVVFGQTEAAPFPLAGQPAAKVAVAAAHDEFGLVLRPDGTVLAWGDNRFGQTNVPAGLSDVIAVAVGQGPRAAHALALRRDGTVAGWGDNTFRQAIPPDGLTGVVAIAAGELHSLALTRNGRLIAWGNSASPAGAVPENLAPAKAIAASANFNLALLNNGLVIAWGLNDAGQCQVPQVSAQAVEIAAGSRHAVVRLKDGTVMTWGDNTAKQCDAPAGLPALAAVFAGGEGSAALDQSGRLHVWGKVPNGVTNLAGRVAQAAIGSSTWVVIERDSAALTQ